MKWISVKDRLPENCNTVLLTDSPKYANGNAAFAWTGFLISYAQKFTNPPEEGREPTHWAPLPTEIEKPDPFMKWVKDNGYSVESRILLDLRDAWNAALDYAKSPEDWPRQNQEAINNPE